MTWATNESKHICCSSLTLVLYPCGRGSLMSILQEKPLSYSSRSSLTAWRVRTSLGLEPLPAGVRNGENWATWLLFNLIERVSLPLSLDRVFSRPIGSTLTCFTVFQVSIWRVGVLSWGDFILCVCSATGDTRFRYPVLHSNHPICQGFAKPIVEPSQFFVFVVGNVSQFHLSWDSNQKTLFWPSFPIVGGSSAKESEEDFSN